MINSLNKSRFLPFFLALPLVITLAVNVDAQTKPRSLVPKAEPLAPPGDFSSPNQPLSPTGSTSKTVIEGTRIQGKMVVEGLQAIDSSSIGLMNEDDKGLGPKMWRGTERSRISRLIDHLPVRTTSPVLQDLLRRVLLTAAIIPSAPGQTVKEDLLLRRLQKLYDAGYPDELIQLSQRVQAGSLSMSSQKLVQEAYLLLGQTARACKDAIDKVQERTDTFWTKSQLICRSLDGQHERVEMGAILLEEGGETDSVFFDLLAIMAGEKIKLDLGDGKFSAHHMALARATKTEIALQKLRASGPGFFRAATQVGEYDDAYRLAAGWQGAEFGVVLLASLEPLLMNEKLVQDFKGPFLLGDYQFAKTSTNAETKKAALENLVMQLSESNSVFPMVSHLSKEISGLQPDSKQTTFLYAPARLFLALEKLETASEWGRQARKAVLAGNIESISNAQAAVGRLDPLLLIAGASGVKKWDARMFLRWRRAHGGLSDEERAAKGNILLSLLDSVGVSVPMSHWQQLADQGSFSLAKGLSPAMIRSLLDAAANGRVGETVSLVLTGLGEGALKELDASSLLVAIGALRQIGLEREARALALEIAIVHNL